MFVERPKKSSFYHRWSVRHQGRNSQKFIDNRIHMGAAVKFLV